MLDISPLSHIWVSSDRSFDISLGEHWAVEYVRGSRGVISCYTYSSQIYMYILQFFIDGHKVVHYDKECHIHTYTHTHIHTPMYDVSLLDAILR